MSKYDPLWKKIADSGQDELMIPFERVQEIAGVPLDHSFLNYKKELQNYGYQVDHIYLKKRQIKVSRIK